MGQRAQGLHVSARIARRTLVVEVDPLPADCVVTLWLGTTMVKRLAPTSARFTIPIPTTPTPHPIARVLVVCAWAPGYHFAETRVSLSAMMPVMVG